MCNLLIAIMLAYSIPLLLVYLCELDYLIISHFGSVVASCVYVRIDAKAALVFRRG